MLARLGLLPLVVAALVLAWNVTLSGWIATRREGASWFRNLTALAGLLIAPAAVLAIAASTDTGARTITGVAWLWPVTCVLMVAQAIAATAGRLVSLSVGVPIVFYNVLLALVAIGDDQVLRSGYAPDVLQGLIAARDAVLGVVSGRAALGSPLSVLIPLIAPAYPARWRSSAFVRAVLVLYAAATLTLLVMEWPRGIGAVRSYDASARTLAPRDARSFALGLRLLPDIAGLPDARAVRTGARLYDRLNPDALLVSLNASAVRSSGLDSLVRVLAPYRSDSVRLIVALSFTREDAIGVRNAPQLASRLRLDALQRVTEALRPNIVIPALPPALPGVLFTPTVSTLWWQQHLREAARTVQRARPQTSVMWVATRFDAADSVMHAWATDSTSPVQLVGFTPLPSFAGLASVDARLRVADRWVAAHGAGARAHWMFMAGLPRAHGDASQSAAIRHVLAWSSRRAYVRGVVIGELRDDVTTLGLISANGRERAVVEMVRRTMPRDDGRR